MKQFQFTNTSGHVSAAYSAEEVAETFPDSARAIAGLAVGESAVDCDGDTWTRLPNDGTQSQAEPPAPARDERRERIATAALQGLLADAYRDGSWADYALDAVRCADALIAKLDEVKE